MDEARFRDKVTWIQFILSVGVIIQHTQLQGKLGTTIQSIHDFVFFVCEICVPFFFVISGYLFFRTYTPENAVKKLKSRIRTLLVPYVLWNTIYAVYMIGLKRLGFIKADIEIRGGVQLLLQLLNSEFSPLWFVKYLMVFSLISPMFFVVIQNKKRAITLVMMMLMANAICYYMGILSQPLNVNENSLVMLNYQGIFYVVGAAAAIHFRDTVEQPQSKRRWVALGVILSLVTLYFAWIGEHGTIVTNHLYRLVFVPCVWFVLDFFSNYHMKWYMKMSFFIYCMHLIVLQCAQGVTKRIINGNAILGTIDYFLIPCFTLVVVIGTGYFMKQKLPKIWSVLTGARG